MNSLLETLLVPDDATWNYFYRRLDDCIPFNWHHHDEFELTFTVNSGGQRYVGDTIEPYGDGDLVFLGSNLPHTWMSQHKVDDAQPHLAHVFWIRPVWIRSLIDTLLELKHFKPMLDLAGRGIVYSSATAKAVRERVDDLRTLPPTARVLRFIEVLTLLGEDQDYRLLCAPHVQHEPVRVLDRPRIDRTLEYIHKHYEAEISIPELADKAALSVSGLHRLFKRHTRLTVGEYVARLRIGKACALLVSSERPVATIASDVGYANISHFNRQFLTIKGVTPREFRRAYVDNRALQPAPAPPADAPSPVHFSLAAARK